MKSMKIIAVVSTIVCDVLTCGAIITSNAPLPAILGILAVLAGFHAFFAWILL
jgi:hypothetical protein